jgi:hypothetical protein
MGTSTTDFQLINYRLAVVVGIIFGFVGVMSQMWGMAGFGVLLLIIGLVNKKKWGKEESWSQLSPKARKTQVVSLIITGVVGLTLITISLALKV